MSGSSVWGVGESGWTIRSLEDKGRGMSWIVKGPQFQLEESGHPFVSNGEGLEVGGQGACVLVAGWQHAAGTGEEVSLAESTVRGGNWEPELGRNLGKGKRDGLEETEIRLYVMQGLVK